MALNNRLKLFIPIAFFGLMVGLLFWGLHQNPSAVQSALLNQPLPAFSHPGLYEEEGVYTEAVFDGRISIINIWGSWCPPCHLEHPFLVEISERDPELQFAGVSYDYSTEPDREFLAERGTPFDINIVDSDGSLRIDLGVTGAPETFLVDSNGIIVMRHIGPIDFRIWDDKFAPVLAQLRGQQ